MSQLIVNTIEKLIPELSLPEQLFIFERLAQQLHHTLQQPNKPQDLYGIWRDAVPQSFDLDQALQGVRHKWYSEWKTGAN